MMCQHIACHAGLFKGKKVSHMGNRIQYLDTLRASAAYVGMLAAAVSNFMVFHPLHAYVPAERQQCWGGFDIFYGFAIGVVVPVIFFLSAYFGASSLRIHMPKPYFRQKWARLGWPWLIGTLLLGTELIYLASLRCGTPADFIIPGTVHEAALVYFQSPFWFLALLVLFHLILTGIKAWKHTIFQQRRNEAPSWLVLAGFYIIHAAIAIGAAALAVTAGGHPAVYIVYIACLGAFYFCLGVYAFKRRWFTPGGYTPSVWCLIPAILACIVYVAGSPAVTVLCLFVWGSPAAACILPIWGAVLSLPMLMGLLAAFAKWNNNEQRKKERLFIALAYPLYVLSDTLLQNTAYALAPLHIAAPLKLVLTLALSLLYGYMICKYALFHLPCFKRH